MNAKPHINRAAFLKHLCGYYGRLAMIAIGLAATMLPWLYFDGFDSAHSGAEMIAFIVAGEGSEKWDMMKTNFIGTFTVLTFPIVITGLQIMTAILLYRARVEPAIHTAVIGLVLAMLLTAASVTSNDRPTIGPFIMPGAGLALVMLTNLAILLTILHDRYHQRQQRQEHSDQYDWEPTV